jgi:hypothetical protein
MVASPEDADNAGDVNVAISCHIDPQMFLAMLVFVHDNAAQSCFAFFPMFDILRVCPGCGP